MLNFGGLPPEINSGRMYSGPGSGPMLVAAAAWDALANELYSAATRYGCIVSELTGNEWLGPAALSMSRAVAPLVAWLHTTASQAEHTAAQAKLAVAAYETAFAMTVPPPVIAANRSLLMALIATNFFGQNAPAIAATEAHYAEMWSQDATAMYGYAGSSAAAGQLSSFTEPPRTNNPAGPAAQSGTGVAADPLSASTLLITGLSATKIVNTVTSTTSSVVSGRGILIVNERLAAAEESAAAEDNAFSHLPMPNAPAQLARTAVSTVSAEIGTASPIGRLSVPASWATSALEIRPVALTLPTPGEASAGMPGQIPVSGNVFSQSVLGTLSRDGPNTSRRKSKPIIVRSPAAG